MIHKKKLITNLEHIKQLNQRDQLDKDTLDQILRETLEHFIYFYDDMLEEPRKYSNFEEYWKAILPVLWNVREWDNDTIKSWIECTFVDSRR